MPGIKVGRSRAQLPLKVEVEEVAVPEGFVQTLNDHLLLVYTGKTRLARNLLQVSPRPGGGREAEAPQGPALHCTLLPHLQDVLRSWYARLPAVVQNAHSLVRHTEECVKAFRQGEVPLPRGRAPGGRGLVALGSKARGLFRLVGGKAPRDRSLPSVLPRVSLPWEPYLRTILASRGGFPVLSAKKQLGEEAGPFNRVPGRQS